MQVTDVRPIIQPLLVRVLTVVKIATIGTQDANHDSNMTLIVEKLSSSLKAAKSVTKYPIDRYTSRAEANRGNRNTIRTKFVC